MFRVGVRLSRLKVKEKEVEELKTNMTKTMNGERVLYFHENIKQGEISEISLSCTYANFEYRDWSSYTALCAIISIKPETG